MARRPIVPGDLFYRNSDRRMGMVVVVEHIPSVYPDTSGHGSWRFKMLVGEVLVDTTRLASDYTRVQTWAS